MIKKPPLFALEIVTVEGGIFDYNVIIKKFEDVTTKAIDNAIAALQTIPQVEAFVMEKLKWSRLPNIGAIQLQEPLIVSLKSRIQVIIARVLDQLLIISNWIKLMWCFFSSSMHRPGRCTGALWDHLIGSWLVLYLNMKGLCKLVNWVVLYYCWSHDDDE